jgi:hypothetical protein
MEMAMAKAKTGRHSKTRPKLSAADVGRQHAAELPDREAMSLVNANLAAPINAAVAANVLSDGSVAYANAAQNTPITQSTGGGALPRP